VLVRVVWLAVLIASALASAFGAGCGESRRPIGDECLRNEDCLSSVCSARTCAPEPTLIPSGGGSPAIDTPRIPDAAADVGEGG
jgi:hypothetical protein